MKAAVTAAVPHWCWAAAALALPVAWLLARLGHGMATPTPLRDLIWLVLLATAEEVIFRGGLQTALAKRPVLAASHWGLSGANLLTSLLFSAAHLWAHTPLQAAAVLPVSLLLGASLEQSGRLRVPVALHIWFNAALYAASYAASWWQAQH
jgi:uncharacterized protein